MIDPTANDRRSGLENSGVRQPGIRQPGIRQLGVSHPSFGPGPLRVPEVLSLGRAAVRAWSGLRRGGRALAVCGGIVTFGAGVVMAQPGSPPVLIRPTAPLTETDGSGTPDTSPEETAARRFPGGAPLRTDPELESMLAQAEKFVAAGRIDLACLRWQQILGQARDVVGSRDGRIYEPLSRSIERRIAKLPPEGRRTYRLQVDGLAAGLLARDDAPRQRPGPEAGGDTSPRAKSALPGDAARREDRLADVIRLYFLSSVGDDAAFELASRLLDRGEATAAAQLLERLLADYPDSDLDETEVRLRLAVARQMRGDQAGAAEIAATLGVGEAASPSSPRVADERIATLAQMLDTPSEGSLGPAASWEIARGTTVSLTTEPVGAKRGEAVATLPEDFFDRELGSLAVFDLGLATVQAGTYQSLADPWASEGAKPSTSGRSRGTRSSGGPTGGMGGFSGGIAFGGETANTVVRWQQGRRPTSEIRLVDGEPIVRTWVDTVRLHPGPGGGPDDGSDDGPSIRWRSAWWNPYVPDRAFQQLVLSGMASAIRPGSAESLGEAQVFADFVHSDLTVADGVVYALEGPQRTPTAGEPTGLRVEPFQWGQVLRRSRTNRLSAYDATSGKSRWSTAIRLADDGEPIGLLTAPVVRRETLLAVATDGSSLYLIAFSARTGKRLWVTYLCDEPAAGSSPMSRPAVLVAGRDVYVLPGTGVVLGVDGEYGDIRFVVRYERDVEVDSSLASQQMSGLGKLRGFARDDLFLAGRTLILCASDHDGLLALDAGDLSVRWRSPRTPFNHPADRAIGIVGDAFFVAGPRCVRKYEISTGRLRWEATTERQTGLPLLTDRGLLVPTGLSIVRLDPATGDVLGTTAVKLPDGELVGNLTADGVSLWSVGIRSVVRLAPTDSPTPADDGPTPSTQPATDRPARGETGPGSTEPRVPERSEPGSSEPGRSDVTPSVTRDGPTPTPAQPPEPPRPSP